LLAYFSNESQATNAAVFSGICHPESRALSLKLNLYSAAGVHPKVPQTTGRGSLLTELDLMVPRLIFAPSDL
jgi:hypothetical protein